MGGGGGITRATSTFHFLAMPQLFVCVLCVCVYFPRKGRLEFVLRHRAQNPFEHKFVQKSIYKYNRAQPWRLSDDEGWCGWLGMGWRGGRCCSINGKGDDGNPFFLRCATQYSLYCLRHRTTTIRPTFRMAEMNAHLHSASWKTQKNLIPHRFARVSSVVILCESRTFWPTKQRSTRAIA